MTRTITALDQAVSILIHLLDNALYGNIEWWNTSKGLSITKEYRHSEGDVTLEICPAGPAWGGNNHIAARFMKVNDMWRCVGGQIVNFNLSHIGLGFGVRWPYTVTPDPHSDAPETEFLRRAEAAFK